MTAPLRSIPTAGDDGDGVTNILNEHWPADRRQVGDAAEMKCMRSHRQWLDHREEPVADRRARRARRRIHPEELQDVVVGQRPDREQR